MNILRNRTPRLRPIKRRGTVHMQKRKFTLGMGNGIRVFAFALVAASFFTINWIRRRGARQVKLIRKKFLSRVKMDYTHPVLRHSEEEKLKKMLATVPSAPVVIIGGDGCGKSVAVKRILADRKMSIIVDFQKTPVNSKNEFLYQVIHETGYEVPKTTVFMQWLLREKNLERKPRINREDMEKAFMTLQTVFASEKNAGWPNGIPVIVINNLEAIDVQIPSGASGSGGVASKKDKDKEKDKGSGTGGGGSGSNNASGSSLQNDEFFKFLNFCMWLSDNRMAHVLLVTTRSYSEGTLDLHPGWRLRRNLFFFPFERIGNIRRFLEEDVTLFLERSGKSMSKDNIEYILAYLGCSMVDITHVLLSCVQGEPVPAAVDRLVGSSVTWVKMTLEAILDTTQGGDEESRYRKYMRFWNMMKLFSTNEKVPRTFLINEIFPENYSEISKYEADDIILFEYRDNSCYVSPSTQRMKVAFHEVLSDPLVLEQKQLVQKKLKKNSLKKEKNELLQELELISKKRREIVTELEIFGSKLDYLRKEDDYQFVEPHVKELISELQIISSTMKAKEAALENINNLLVPPKEEEKKLVKEVEKSNQLKDSQPGNVL